jgi:thioredoxin reductase (NADPH)
MHELVDLTIIGGGPTGLFASFYAGMRGATARIVDNLPQLGGQLTALYPEKYIFDVGGYRQILAKDLVNELANQAGQFNFPSFLNQHVVGLEEEGRALRSDDGDRPFSNRAVVIAAGHWRVQSAPASAEMR